MLDIGLYIHVAFCRRRCFYCDFNVFVGLDTLIECYVGALLREMAMTPPGVAAGSLFFGGGTPSMLSIRQVDRLVDVARQRLHLQAGDEVTLEANPCDLSADYLSGLRAVGVNRLSVGVQSFDDAILRKLGRRHDARQALDSYRLARDAGFDNVSLDLMFGLPGQDLAQWHSTLDTALALRPEHLSLYCLTLEEGTPFAKWVGQGKLVVPGEDESAEMYEAARELLGAAGYEHYEISNWARREAGRDLRGQHNLRYWRNQPYLGVGAGAHSFLTDHRPWTIDHGDGPPLSIVHRPSSNPSASRTCDARRFHDVLDAREYVRRLEAGESPVEDVEPIARELEMAETLILGLRLGEGVERQAFRGRFGEDLAGRYARTIAELAGLGLVELTPLALRLTPRGQLLGNEVFQRFLPS